MKAFASNTFRADMVSHNEHSSPSLGDRMEIPRAEPDVALTSCSKLFEDNSYFSSFSRPTRSSSLRPAAEKRSGTTIPVPRLNLSPTQRDFRSSVQEKLNPDDSHSSLPPTPFSAESYDATTCHFDTRHLSHSPQSHKPPPKCAESAESEFTSSSTSGAIEQISTAFQVARDEAPPQNLSYETRLDPSEFPDGLPSPSQSPSPESHKPKQNGSRHSAWESHHRPVLSMDQTTSEGPDTAEMTRSSDSMSFLISNRPRPLNEAHSRVLSTSPEEFAVGNSSSEASSTERASNDSAMKKTQSPKVLLSSDDVRQTQQKLFAVQQRFFNVTNNDESRTGTCSTTLSLTKSPERVSLDSLELPREGILNPREKDIPLSGYLLPSKDRSVEDIARRAYRAEEKVLELETDCDFLRRECRQLRDKLSSAISREESLQRQLAESKLVALRDKQMLEARHRDAVAELRRMIHHSTSKAESLEHRLREEYRDEKSLYAASDAALYAHAAGRASRLQDLAVDDTRGALSVVSRASSNNEEDRVHWEIEYQKLERLLDDKDSTLQILHGQVDEHEQYIRVLEGRVDEAEHEITRLLESETLLRDDLRQRTQEYETITFQHEREKEVQERAVALLEKQIQGLQSDCRRFQKLLRQKDREMASEVATLCNRFSEMENQHEAIIAQRVAEREAELIQRMDSLINVQTSEKLCALRAHYEAVILRLKHQSRASSRRRSSHIKDYIKTEVSRAVAETVHPVYGSISQAPCHRLPKSVSSAKAHQLPFDTLPPVSGELAAYPRPVLSIGTAVAPDELATSHQCTTTQHVDEK